MKPLCRVGSILMTFVLAGCVSSSRNEQLDSLSRGVGAVNKNMTSVTQQLADISTRLDSTEQSSREAQGLQQENQAKLDRLEKSISDLTNKVYKMNGFTPAPPVNPGGAEFTPPPVTPPPNVAAPVPPAEPPVESPPPPPPPPPVKTADAGAAPSEGAVAEFNAITNVYNKKDYAAALTGYDGFLKKYANTPYASKAQFWKGMCVLQMGKTEEAIVEFDKVRKNYPQSDKVPSSLLYKAKAYQKLGQTDRTLQILREIIDNYPMTPEADQAKKLLNNK